MIPIIIDTREQQPWAFAEYSTTVQKLDTGDYTIRGMEDVLCIERKKSVSELATNIMEDRFWREMERMGSFTHKFLILEFDYRHIMDYPEGSDLPKRVKSRIRIRGPFIIKKMCEIQMNHSVHILPCGNTENAEFVATNIIKKVYEMGNAT